MGKKRTNTYYVYNARNGEFLGCGSLTSVRDYFDVVAYRIEAHANSDEPLALRKYNMLLNISKVEGTIENIPFTVELVEREKPLSIKRNEGIYRNALRKNDCARCNFVEVFKIFRRPRNEEEKEYLRTHFSIINLNRVSIELDTRSFVDGFPFRINFRGRGNTIVFSEAFFDGRLAEERLKYLENFQAKQRNGDFWYNKDRYDATRIICIDRTRSGKNKIVSFSCETTKKTSYKEYLDLVQYLQSEYIR